MSDEARWDVPGLLAQLDRHLEEAAKAEPDAAAVTPPEGYRMDAKGRAWERQAGVRRPWVADLAAGVGLLALFLALVWLWLVTPVVSQVWPTGECVQVDPPHTCAAPPARYAVQWVAPAQWRAP